MKPSSATNETARMALRRSKTCKTCTLCRVKKVRCCGTRPRCTECVNDELECTYPQDARSDPRPSKARVRTLEATVAAMLDFMKTSGIVPPDTQPEQWLAGTVKPAVLAEGNRGKKSKQVVLATPNPSSIKKTLASDARGQDMHQSPTPSPTFSLSEPTQLDLHNESVEGADNTPSSRISRERIRVLDTNNARSNMSLQVPQRLGHKPQQQHESPSQNAETLSSLSPSEASVAAILHSDGCISSVHGLTSLMNHTPKTDTSNVLDTRATEEAAVAAMKARLISYAALQSQREGWIYNQPQTKIDFDGCDPDLAKHLIDLHFNRFHYAYLISYRPAIIDSIASGGGPWVNKLLLNSIYYASSLFSDRPGLQETPNDPQSIGARFYNRFCQLLCGELSRPSIPSAVALLLTSSSLVSHGWSSAGWNLSGLAYRMVIDLGCHLTLGPDCNVQVQGESEGKNKLNDVEQEMRKRLYWGAYAIDATQALYLGRPCMFAPVEARVPVDFLDTFEELERWEPHYDPQTPSNHPPPYSPQPAYGVSTFTALIRLFQTATRIIKLYGIDSIKSETEHILRELLDVDEKLQQWSDTLSAHLRFDPEGSRIPPPHQIILHTTFHALNILLHRAFLPNGHLWHHSNSSVRIGSEKTCLDSALEISKYVRCYRETFTLRNAPYLLCYATYSAVIIILRQERHQRGDYIELISYFWTCLSELQKGCNFGMKKPLAILKDMVREYNVSSKEIGAGESGDENHQVPKTSLDESIFSTLPLQSYGDASILDVPSAVGPASDHDAMNSFNDEFHSSTPGFMSYVDDRECNIWDDSLYGLFTSSLPFG